MVITLGFSKIISHSRGVLFKGGICSLCLLVKEKNCSPDLLLRASICSELILSFTSWLVLERRGRQNENEVASPKSVCIYYYYTPGIYAFMPRGI